MAGFDPRRYRLHLAQLRLAGGLTVFNPQAHPRGAAGGGMGGKFIQSGSSGTGVQNVQKKLGGVQVDGKYGPKTEAAIRAYQQKNGLQVDGVVGAQTAAALLGQGQKDPGALTPAQAKALGLGNTSRKSRRASSGSKSGSAASKGPQGTTNVAQALRSLGWGP